MIKCLIPEVLKVKTLVREPHMDKEQSKCNERELQGIGPHQDERLKPVVQNVFRREMLLINVILHASASIIYYVLLAPHLSMGKSLRKG